MEKMVIHITKKQSLIKEWDKIVDRAKEKLENSKKCYKEYGDETSKQWVEEDEENLKQAEERRARAIKKIESYEIIY